MCILYILYLQIFYKRMKIRSLIAIVNELLIR